MITGMIIDMWPGSIYPGMAMKGRWIWGYERKRVGDNEVV